MTTNSLSVADYVVFVLILVISLAIGIYFGIKQRRSSATDMLLGGRSMSILPVTLSLTASFMSAITLLGTPAEIYGFTTIYLWISGGFIFGTPISAHFYVPIFYNLKLTSIFEYIQMRFGTALRLASVIIYMFQMVLYTALVLYAPSLALQAATGLNVWVSVMSVGIICTIYTTIGGMKAVLWTDAFQMAIMIIGLIAVLVQGSIDHKGFSNIWNYLKESGRVEHWNFSPNPTVRHTNWSLVVGGTALWLPIYATNQAQIQRALSLPSLKKAQLAYYISIPCLVALVIICGLCGMVCYAEYRDCDPLSSKQISSGDQILPWYVMEKLAYLPGIPGLFIASLFSGTLSTISSTLNSLSAVTLEDLIRPYCCPKITDRVASLLTKILAFVYGAVCIGLTFVAAQLGGILQASMSLFGLIGGPQLGLFTLGIFFPCANHIGAFIGFFAGLVMTFWIGMGAQIYKRYIKRSPSPVSVMGCPVDNSSIFTTEMMQYTSFTTLESVTTPAADINQKEDSGYLEVYSLSYLWYSSVAVLVVCTVGVIASLISDAIMKPEKKKMDPRLIYPILSKLMPCLPSNIKNFLSCYVDHSEKSTMESNSKENLDQDGDLGVHQDGKSQVAYVNYAADKSMDSIQPQDHCIIKETHI